MRAVRFDENPIIRPDMDARMGANINGPSLMRVPDWLPDPLGRYYLYFAAHDGKYIRLAFADELAGPWTMHEPGTLRLEQTFCRHHVASPDVHVDNEARRIRMYFHGPHPPDGQVSAVALSEDGLHFEPRHQILGRPYFRLFQWRDMWYALGMPGRFYRSPDGLTDFESGPLLFTKDMRHSALKRDGDTLTVLYSNAYDCPEHILASRIELTPDWMSWTPTEPETVLRPETEAEGADQPLVASRRGMIRERVHQLRDPGIYRENGRTWLLYSVAGEHGIGIAELFDD